MYQYFGFLPESNIFVSDQFHISAVANFLFQQIHFLFLTQSTFSVWAGNYFLCKTIFGNEPDTFFDWLWYIFFVTATLLRRLEYIFLSVCLCFLSENHNFLCQSMQIFKWVCPFFMSRNAIFWASGVQTYECVM